MSYDRDPKYAHPLIVAKLANILQTIQAKLPVGVTCKMLSAHRTPADQFELFKKGRALKDGKWVVTNKKEIVTDKDGYIKRSRHNYLPCTAIDIGLFDAQNKYIPEATAYQFVSEGKSLHFDWGGDWKTLVDQPHLQIAASDLFQNDLEKDNGFIWQQYLLKAGTYDGVLDGIFGSKSMAALKAATGESERNMKAWNKLHEAHGQAFFKEALKLRSLDGRPEPGLSPRPQPNPNSRPQPNPVPRPHP